jgi:surfeit locus 1 family protein
LTVETDSLDRAAPHSTRATALLLAGAALALAVLMALGTWQVQRLAWKEGLIATIEQRAAADPAPLSAIERIWADTGDVDYYAVRLDGRFLHDHERHFFATHRGASGWYVYTPLMLDDGRAILVNRGFVPYDRKDPATRAEGQAEGTVALTGLARNPVAEKPSMLLPDNDPAANVFYWKDIALMRASSGLDVSVELLPFFVDAARSPQAGGLPEGGVTIVDLPNNHLQYAVTWYGLAAALLAVLGAWLWRRRRP